MTITTVLQGFVQRGSRLRPRLDHGRAMGEFGVGGTDGGINTTTVASLVAATRSNLRGEDTAVIRRRAIFDKVVLRAIGVTLSFPSPCW